MSLSGKKILITRSKEQASELIEKLKTLGAEVVCLPTIKILPPEDFTELDLAIKNIGNFNWIIFTSVNGAEFFFKRLSGLGLSASHLNEIKKGAIGSSTKRAIEKFGLKVDFLPQCFYAEALAEELEKKVELKGTKILLPSADIARPFLKEKLKQLGADVTEIVAYRTVPENGDTHQVWSLIKKRQIEWVTFTSSSTVKNFTEILGKENLLAYKNNFKIASIGPITSQTIKEVGLEVNAQAQVFNLDGLVQAMVEYNKS